MSYHTKEGLLVGIGLLALAGFGFSMSHTPALVWLWLALTGVASLFSVWYLRSRR
jgi:hypothetical protein